MNQNLSNSFSFEKNLLNEKVLNKLKGDIETYVNELYTKWKFKGKTTIRFNFKKDARKT
jgi:hypothetical protein